MNSKLSNRLRHDFHVISNVRPVYWICLYVVLIPFFALIYWALPDGQFRIPDGSGTDFGSWIYYSIVTITTLGFGDYTPAHVWAQLVTAVEVTCGLLCMGFFLNSVGAMKSEIDVDEEVQRQRLLHQSQEQDKLLKNIPQALHLLNTFLAFCYAVTTPLSIRKKDEEPHYNPDFKFSDMADLYKPSHLPIDATRRPAVTGLLKNAFRTSLVLDSMQTNIDLTLWPALLEDCFSFVANYQMFSSADDIQDRMMGWLPEEKAVTMDEMERHISKEIAESTTVPDPDDNKGLAPIVELYQFIKENATIAEHLETELTKLSQEADQE